MAAVVNAALFASPFTFSEVLLQAEATRRNPGAVRLDWTGPNEATDVFVSTDPDAPPSYMRALKSGLRANHCDLPLAISPRPYFLLRTTGGSEVRVAERLLPLQGGKNFRDLGGYRAQDGRQVRWGRIYRSGVMNQLTVPDMKYLSNLGIEEICDLRSTQERAGQPNPFIRMNAPQVVATDYDMVQPTGVMKARSAAEAIDAFADVYVQFAQALVPQYTDLFAHLMHRETPIAFNCSAGKDRTGIGAALVLSVLGVPRETVIADYALTQVYMPPAVLMQQLAHAQSDKSEAAARQADAFAAMPLDVRMVLLGSDPAIMRRALDQFDQKYGGPVELAKASFGLTDEKIAYLRSVYLI